MRTAVLVGTLIGLCLGGCVDLKAISDYSASAEQIVSDPSAAVRWRDSEKHLVALRMEGDTCPIGRPGRRPQSDFDAAFEQAAAIHATLGKYFDALGQLASDKLPMPAQATSSSLDAIKKAGVDVSAADANAVNAIAAVLSRALDAYRQRKVRELMDQTQGDLDRTMTLLQRLVSIYIDEVQGERIQAMGFLRCALAANDISDKY